jgi:hypothetical protein
MVKVLGADHRTNWLLASLEAEDFAALEPHLELVELSRGQVLYEPGDPLRYAYFPHYAVVSLVNMMEDGGTVEVALFGRGGVLGRPLVTREAFVRYVVQIDGTWFGTLRARAGVAFDRALIYATGGLAFSGADDNNRFGIGSDDDINWGWTVGGGVEYAFTNNLTFKIEGLYVNLDQDDNDGYVGTAVSAGGVATDVFVPGAGNDNDNDFFIARAGLNFKFGSY